MISKSSMLWFHSLFCFTGGSYFALSQSALGKNAGMEDHEKLILLVSQIRRVHPVGLFMTDVYIESSAIQKSYSKGIKSLRVNLWIPKC